MRIDIISVLPELIESPFNASILRRAIDKKLIEVFFHDLKEYSSNKRKQVDDYQFGGGSGMVLMIEPIKKCIDSLKSQRTIMKSYTCRLMVKCWIKKYQTIYP